MLVGNDGMTPIPLFGCKVIQSSMPGFDGFASTFTCKQLENQGAKPGSREEKKKKVAKCGMCLEKWEDEGIIKQRA